jgi:hypothetical protein
MTDINRMKTGQRVKIDHPFYGQRVVTIEDFDGPKGSTVNDTGLCTIDGARVWFDQDMIVSA